ncbi:DNA adenine methylase [Clostridium isatidis]|uniref:DNA adenine methylase n=1 Tax=Clostridium isatidis TaxID=182773 RepID=UPI003AACAF5C
MKIQESCLNWYGGKGGRHQRKILREILEYIDKSNKKVFVDVFGGSGIVTINVKNKIRKYNDLNLDLFNFFEVLKDEKLSEDLSKRLILTLYHEEIYNKAKKEVLSTQDFKTPNLERAINFYISTMQSYNSLGAMKISCGFRTSNTKMRNGMSQAVSSWRSNVDLNLKNAIEEFRKCEVYNYDFIECINKFDSQNTVFYLDPPYISDTRNSKNVYLNELNKDRHIEMVDKLLKIKGQAILSGYDHIIYKPLEDNGWIKKEINVKTSSSKRGKNARVECIWYKEN